MNSFGRALTGFGVARTIGPANSVSLTPSVICSVVMVIVLLVLNIHVFKVQETRFKNSDNVLEENVEKGWAVAIIGSIVGGMVLGGLCQTLRFYWSNPAYLAAQEGLNAIF